MVVLCKEKKFFIGLSLGFLRMMFAVGSQVLNLSGYPSHFTHDSFNIKSITDR